MFRKSLPSFFSRISVALLALVILTACSAPVNLPAAAPVVAPTTPAASSAPSVTVDATGVAHGIITQAVDAVAPSDTVAWTAVMPAHVELTFQGYAVSNSTLKAQIFVYPVGDLGVNQTAAQQAADLQVLLQNQQLGDQMPYLPLMFSARQAMHAQVKTLDFKNGKGVRFLTQWGNGIVPVNNEDLLYAFQGLTGDGKYYVSAVLPVTLPGLPPDSLSGPQSQAPAIPFPAAPTSSNLSDQQIQDFGSQYRQYMAGTIQMLNQQSLSVFVPDLSKLDALVQSIKVK